MSNRRSDGATLDIGEYCRRVERHLTRVNGGHLVRIVGPGFDLVRRWAQEGIPLNIVFAGIERKAERHRHGQSRRPLRIEFCEADVDEVFEDWRRAVGLFAATDPGGGGESSDEGRERRRPSLSRHFERAVGRLDRALARPDCPPEVSRRLTACRDELETLGEGARTARGKAREKILARLESLDADLLQVARRWADADLAGIRQEAEADLSPYRERLSADAWQGSVQVTADRLLRDRLHLPTLTLT